MFRNVWLRFFRSILRHKVHFSFTSTSYLPSFSFNISILSFLIIFFAVLSFITLLLFNSLLIADYYAIKSENLLLKNKINRIIKDVNDGANYLYALKKAHEQLKEITFQSEEKNINLVNIGGATLKESTIFRNIINNIDYSKLNEKQISDAYKKIKEESELRLRDYEKLFNYITTMISKTKSTPRGWPTQGNITSPFGYRIHPFTFSYEFHTGIDITNDPGTDIKVTADGVVRYVGWAFGYGLCIIVDHGFGYSTLYGHLSQALVKQGDIIEKGTVIGKMGSTGTSTGSHLHYEVWEYGVPKNPYYYMVSSSKNGA